MNAPVDTGALRRSIYSTVEQVEPMHYKGIIGPPDGMDYAVYQEWGTGLFSLQDNGRQTPWVYQRADGNWITTVGNHPQPFLRPALDDNRNRIDRTIEDFINGALNG